MLAASLLGVGCKEERPAPPAEAWATWANGLALKPGPSGVQGIVERLSSRAKSQKRLRPFRKLARARALEESRRYFQQIRAPNPAAHLLVPPVDWGKVPDQNRNALMQKNEWRPLIPVLWTHYHTEETRCIEQLERVALDWIDYNLVDDRPNSMKWHDMATGLRSVRLAYLIDARLRSDPKADSALPKLIWAAAKHAEQLRKPEMFTEGNHGLYAVLGLRALVTALPELENAKSYAKYADTKMRYLLDTRYSKDGFHKEHSPGYQEVTNKSVRDILAVGLFDVDRAVRKKLEAARQVSYQLFHPNGDLLLIGDSGRGRGKRVSELESQREFLGSDGKRGSAPASGLIAHPDVGYAFFRSPWSERPFAQHSYLFFATGYHSSHHKHADHLTFEWSEKGQPILVDSGKYEYSRSEWRHFFTSTRAGNAIEVDERDHSVKEEDAWGGGLTAWGTVGPLQFMNAQVKYPVSDVQHSRTLVLYPRKWLCLIDEMRASKVHSYRQWLHLHEAFTVERFSDHFVARHSNAMQVFIRPLETEPELGLELMRGMTKPRIQGWLSASYREKRKRDSLAFSRKQERVRFVTLLSLDNDATKARVDEIEGGVRVRFSRGSEQHDFSVVGGKLSER